MAQAWGLRGARLPLRLAGRYHLDPINALQLLGPRALGGPADYFGHENYWEIGRSRSAWSRWSWRRSAWRWSPRPPGGPGLAGPGRRRRWCSPRAGSSGCSRCCSSSSRGWTGSGSRPGRCSWRAWGRRCWPGWGRGPPGPVGRRRAVAAAGPSGRGRRRLGLAILLGGGPGGGRVRPTPARLGPRRPGSPEAGPMAPGPGAALGATRPSGWRWAARRSGSPGRGGGRAIAGRSPRLWGCSALVELGLVRPRLIVTAPAGRFLGPDPIGEALLPARPPGRRAAPNPGRRLALRRPPGRPDRVRQDERQRLVPDPARRRPLRDALPPLRRPTATTEARRWTRPSRPSPRDPPGGPRPDGRLAPGRPTGSTPARPGRWSPRGSGDGSPFVVLPEPDRPAPGLRRPPGRGRARRRLDRRPVPRGRPRDGGPDGRPTRSGRPDGPRQPFTPGGWASTDPDRVVLQVDDRGPRPARRRRHLDARLVGRGRRPARPVLRGNRAQRVIPLAEPGRHEIVLRYRPPGLADGPGDHWLGSALVWVWPGPSISGPDGAPSAAGTGRGATAATMIEPDDDVLAGVGDAGVDAAVVQDRHDQAADQGAQDRPLAAAAGSRRRSRRRRSPGAPGRRRWSGRRSRRGRGTGARRPGRSAAPPGRRPPA